MLNILSILTALPETGPRISGGRKTYYKGDTVRVNCTSARSKPAAKLHWFVNNHAVIKYYQVYFYIATSFNRKIRYFWDRYNEIYIKYNHLKTSFSIARSDRNFKTFLRDTNFFLPNLDLISLPYQVACLESHFIAVYDNNTHWQLLFRRKNSNTLFYFYRL